MTKKTTKPVKTKRSNDQIEACKVLGKNMPEFRFSYEHLFEPQQSDEGGGKFGVTALYNKKKADIKALHQAAKAAAKQMWGDKYKTMKIHWPFRDGDKEQPERPEYKGTTYLSFKCKKKPKVFLRNGEIATQEEIKSGDYGKASVIAFAYDYMGKKGVSFALLSVQKTRDGEPLGGYDSSSDYDFDDSNDDEFNEEE